MKTINIMTSCDGNLLKYIPIQLESINVNLKNRNVNFYLFHDGKEQDYINKLKQIPYNNIIFNDVVVEDADVYEAISRGGAWHGAAYYSLCAYKYLPQDMDRILYIDAGDVLIINDIDEYYFDDFEDKILIVTGIRYKLQSNEVVLFSKEDLFDQNLLPDISRGIFNSGSYVINLNKMRKKNYSIDSYLTFAELLYEARGKIQRAYFGDQGFMSLIFIGDIKIFDYPKIIDLWYMPYDFCMSYFEKMKQKVDYNIHIIHYIGKDTFKPWFGKYPIFLERFQSKEKLRNLNDLKLGQAQYYYMWHEYAIMANNRLNACNINGL